MAKEKDEKDKNEPESGKVEKTIKVRPTNTKTIPIMITLAAALVACIMSILQHVELKIYVERLLISVVVFGIIGIVIRVILDRYFFRTKDLKEALDEKKDDDASADKDEESDDEE